MNSSYLPDPVLGLEVEAHLHVNAAVAEVSVERRLIVVFVEQLAAARGGTGPSRSGATDASSQPSKRGSEPGTADAARGPDSRIFQTALASAAV